MAHKSEAKFENGKWVVTGALRAEGPRPLVDAGSQDVALNASFKVTPGGELEYVLEFEISDKVAVTEEQPPLAGEQQMEPPESPPPQENVDT